MSFDIYGRQIVRDQAEEMLIRGMHSPVRCGRTADDRGETGWKSTKDYYPINKRENR